MSDDDGIQFFAAQPLVVGFFILGDLDLTQTQRRIGRFANERFRQAELQRRVHGADTVGVDRGGNRLDLRIRDILLLIEVVAEQLVAERHLAGRDFRALFGDDLGGQLERDRRLRRLVSRGGGERQDRQQQQCGGQDREQLFGGGSFHVAPPF